MAFYYGQGEQENPYGTWGRGRNAHDVAPQTHNANPNVFSPDEAWDRERGRGGPSRATGYNGGYYPYDGLDRGAFWRRQLTNMPVVYRTHAVSRPRQAPARALPGGLRSHSPEDKSSLARDRSPQLEGDDTNLDCDDSPHFHCLCNTTEPQNITIHLELPITEDFDAELEEFSRLRRLGNFKAAIAHFEGSLGLYIDNPYVFVQYASMLLEMGDFQSFERLDANVAFEHEPIGGYSVGGDGEDGNTSVRKPRSGSHFPSAKEKDLNFRASLRDVVSGDDTIKYDPLELCQFNWDLLQALCRIYRDGTIGQATTVASVALGDFKFGPTMGSTEIQIVSLVLHLISQILRSDGSYNFGYIGREAEKWVDWPQLYDNLQAQGRLWDFRDVFIAASAAFGTQQACEIFFGTQNWADHVIGDWKLTDDDESTNIALLDMLMSIAFSDSVVEHGGAEQTLNRILEYLGDAGPIAENIIKHHPGSMKSRPFSLWILAKAAESGYREEERLLKPRREPFHYVLAYEGLRFRESEWAGLPSYAPLSTENPGWRIPNAHQEDTETMRMALEVAKELQDYHTQVLCYKMLILRSQDPQLLFEELTLVQKTKQGDNHGHLRTLVTRYLTCKDRKSSVQLYGELKATDDWLEGSMLREPRVYCARDFIQRALSIHITGTGNFLPLRKSGLLAYPWLSNYVADFLGKAARVGILPLRPYPNGRAVHYDVHGGADGRHSAPPQGPPAPPRTKNHQKKGKASNTTGGVPVLEGELSSRPRPSWSTTTSGSSDILVSIHKQPPSVESGSEAQESDESYERGDRSLALVPYDPSRDELQRLYQSRASDGVHGTKESEAFYCSTAYHGLSGADDPSEHGKEALDETLRDGDSKTADREPVMVGQPGDTYYHGRHYPEADSSVRFNKEKRGAAPSTAAAAAAQNERISRRSAAPTTGPDNLPQGFSDNHRNSVKDCKREIIDYNDLAAKERLEIATRATKGRSEGRHSQGDSTGVWDGWGETSRRKHHKRTTAGPHVTSQRPGNSSPILRGRHRGDRVMITEPSSLPDRPRKSRRPGSGDIDVPGRPISAGSDQFTQTADRDGDHADNEEAGEKNMGKRTSKGKTKVSKADPVVSSSLAPGQFSEPRERKNEQDTGDISQDNKKPTQPSKTAVGVTKETKATASGKQPGANDTAESKRSVPQPEPEQTISRRPTVADPSPEED